MRKKKSTAILLLLAIIAVGALAFTACDLDDPEPADNIIPEGVDEKGISYIWADSHSFEKPGYIIIKSLEQLREYTGLLPDEISSDKYDSSFFENSNLIIIQLLIGSHRKLKVEKIVLQDNAQLYVRIHKIIPPGVFPAMINPMFILIPVKKEYFNGEEVIVEYRKTYPKR